MQISQNSTLFWTTRSSYSVSSFFWRRFFVGVLLNWWGDLWDKSDENFMKIHQTKPQKKITVENSINMLYPRFFSPFPPTISTKKRERTFPLHPFPFPPPPVGLGDQFHQSTLGHRLHQIGGDSLVVVVVGSLVTSTLTVDPWEWYIYLHLP